MHLLNILNEQVLPNRAYLDELSAHFKAYGKYDEKYVQEFADMLSENDDFDPYDHLVASDKINPHEDCVLTISEPNTKLKSISAPSFNLPAGYTCLFAKKCKSIANKHGKTFSGTDRKIKDQGDIRCYAASDEVQYPLVRSNRWSNFDLLKPIKNNSGAMADLILKSINVYEKDKGIISILRIHSSGDFFSQAYFDAWVDVATKRKGILFYAYTKALPFWKKSKDDIPKNLRLIASEGGTEDALIASEKFRKAVIVNDEGEAIKRKLHIDVNDFLAAFGNEDFALLLHGTQSKESGLNSQSRKNSVIAKKVASKLDVDPYDVLQLIRKYTYQ